MNSQRVNSNSSFILFLHLYWHLLRIVCYKICRIFKIGVLLRGSSFLEVGEDWKSIQLTEELVQYKQTCIIVHLILTGYHPCFGYIYSAILAFAVSILVILCFVVVCFYCFSCGFFVKLLIY